MSFQILTINPGSTSTKIAIFEDEKEIFSKTLRHTAEELSPYATVASQFQFRKNIILSELRVLFVFLILFVYLKRFFVIIISLYGNVQSK